MKRKNLNALSLGKKVISRFVTQKIVGGDNPRSEGNCHTDINCPSSVTTNPVAPCS